MKGFALLEILVALFILSFGLLSVAGMELAGLQQTEESYFQNIAILQLSSLLERLRVNQSSSARNHELIDWNTINSHLLPHGIGNYQCEKNICTVQIQWKTRQAHTRSLSGTVTSTWLLSTDGK